MLISFITPTYKRLEYIKKNLKSFEKLHKMFNNFEWVIVAEKDDLSTIKFLKKKNKKFIKLKIGIFKSVEKAFTAGIKKSNGNYVNFHGDDDFFEEKNFKLIKKSLFKSDVKWIIFHGGYVNSKYKEIRKIISFTKFFLLKNYQIFDLSLINYLMTPSIFVKKNVFIKFGGLGSVKRPVSDYRLWLKIYNVYEPKIYPYKLTYAMIDQNTITGNFVLERYIFQTCLMLKYTKLKITKFLIIIIMSAVIIYNFITKSFNFKTNNPRN